MSRRDRPTDVLSQINHGGTAIYRRSTYPITHVAGSPIAERSWSYIPTDSGPVLLGLWYRAGSSPDAYMDSLGKELSLHGRECIGRMLVGDLNIWHARWLTYSPSNSTEGERLWSICKSHGIKQIVTQPTPRSQLIRSRTHIFTNIDQRVCLNFHSRSRRLIHHPCY